MRLDVTPLGATSRSVTAVAHAVVDYLEGELGDPAAGLFNHSGGGGAAAYYGDSPEGPGRWIGAGATYHRLTGTVDRDAFQRLLEGRHPHSGARLLTARGSSQRSHLAVGAAARYDELGQPLYDLADTAALLGITRADVTAMLTTRRSSHPAGDVGERELSSVVIDGDTYIPDSEITRHLDLAATRPTGQRVLAGGQPDDLLTVTQAAAALGVTPRFVRRLCAAATPAGNDEPGVARLQAVKVSGRYRIRRGDLADFADHRRVPVARVGYDLTLTVEKSFGVVMLLADEHVGQRFVDALDTANTTAMAHLDRHAAVGRRRGEVVSSEGLVGASYFHATSRALEPHPHRHNVIANAVVDDAGGIRALDARALYRQAPAAAALATAAARWELRDLGLGWRRRDDRVWEIDGVSDAVIEEFSSRDRQIREITTALEQRLGRRATSVERRTIWADTRAPKTAIDPAGLVANWRDRADRVGFDVDACIDRADRAIVYETLPPDRVSQLFRHLAAPDHGLCAGVDRFHRGDVIKAIADWAIQNRDGSERKVLLPPVEIERLADGFLACDHVIALAPELATGAIRRRDGRLVDDGQAQRCYSTREVLAVQQRVLGTWSKWRNVGRGLVDPATLDAALVRHGGLSDEQIALVRSWCTSGDVAQGGIGRAGTGKTTTMRAAADAWTSAGFRVVGVAVKGEAARQLADDAGIDADTVALLLARARHHRHLLDARTVVIVDEASTLGDRDVDALLRLVTTNGATLRTVGDPAQHRSVPTGGCWSYLVTRHPTPELSTVHRLEDPGERERADAVRHGQIRHALDSLVTSGQLDLSDSDADTYAKMLIRWLDTRNDGRAHPMVHGRNRERRVLNQLVQQLLIDAGDVDPTRSVTTRDGRRLCVGDDVIARHGDRRTYPPGEPEAWMRNGTTGTITAADAGTTVADDRITISTASGTIVCPRRVFDRARGGIDHRYAVTSYAMQGATRDVSTSAITATTSRAELYVDMTRGRHSNQLYGTRRHQPGDDDSDTHLPSLDRNLVDDLANRLATGTGTPVAAADPTAARLAASGQRRTLAKLLAERRAGHSVDDDELERATATVRATAPIPGELVHLLPATLAPYLHRRLADLAGDIAVHQAGNHRLRRPPTTAAERILGPQPNDAESLSSWERLLGALTDLLVAVHTASTAGRHPDLGSATSDQPGHVRNTIGAHLDSSAASSHRGLSAAIEAVAAAATRPTPANATRTPMRTRPAPGQPLEIA